LTTVVYACLVPLSTEAIVPLIEVKPGTPLIPQGTYLAVLTGIKPKKLHTQYSKPGVEDDFLEWTWEIDTDEKTVEITSLTSLATGPKSRIYEYLLALVGPEKAQIGAGFEETDLVGKTVMASVVVTEDGFSKIETIVPAPKTRAAAPAAAPKAEAKPVEVAPSPAPEDDLPF